MNNAKLHSSYTKLTASISWRMGLRQDEQGAYVYVVTPEKTAQLRRVKLGDIEGDKAVILENLALNDVVALEGFDKLHEGSHVDIVQKDGQSVAPTPDNQLTSNNKAHKKTLNDFFTFPFSGIQSLKALYFAPRCNLAVNGGDAAYWRTGLSFTARVSLTTSRLPDHSSDDALSRSES